MTVYLHSPQWYRRRDQWFTDERHRTGTVRCIVCRKASPIRQFELHHLDYSGVKETATGWDAGEQHEDIVAAHKRCHEWIHKLLDRDKAADAAGDRRAANTRVIKHLRAKIARSLGLGPWREKL